MKRKAKRVFEFFGKMGRAFRRRSAQARADELGCRIRAAIDEGRFELSYGYLAPAGTMAYPNGLRFSVRKFQVCHGCAVAAAAFACGQEYGDQEICQRKVVEHDLMSAAEAAQLEMGYEGGDFDFTWTGRKVKRDTSSPFYQLGKAMAIKSKHTEAYRD